MNSCWTLTVTVGAATTATGTVRFSVCWNALANAVAFEIEGNMAFVVAKSAAMFTVTFSELSLLPSAPDIRRKQAEEVVFTLAELTLAHAATAIVACCGVIVHGKLKVVAVTKPTTLTVLMTSVVVFEALRTVCTSLSKSASTSACVANAAIEVDEN